MNFRVAWGCIFLEVSFNLSMYVYRVGVEVFNWLERQLRTKRSLGVFFWRMEKVDMVLRSRPT